MGARTTIKETEESDAEKTSDEASIFSTILADIEQNPTILQKQKNLSAGFSIFTPILSDIDGENPTILQKKNKKTRIRGSAIDFTRTVSQTLTHSYLVDILSQELKTLKSEMETKGRECNCVEEQRKEVKFLADEVLEWSDLKSDVSTDAEDSVCKGKAEDGDTLENFDEMLSTMLGDENEQVDKAKGGGGIDEFIEKILGKIEKGGSYLERIKDEYVFGDLLEDLLRNKLREKAEKEGKEISSWITYGDPEVEIGVAEEKKEEKRETPVKVTLEMSEQEPTVSTKGDYFGLHLIEHLREGNENLMKRRVKAVRFGVEFSFLVAEYMFLIPNELLASEIEDYWICLRPCSFAHLDDSSG